MTLSDDLEYWSSEMARSARAIQLEGGPEMAAVISGNLSLSELLATTAKLVRGIAPPHKCDRIGEAVMGPGRSWWIGKLTEPFYAPDGTEETHCLHMTSPLKGEVVFLLIPADFEWLALFCARVLGVDGVAKWIESDDLVKSRLRPRTYQEQSP